MVLYNRKSERNKTLKKLFSLFLVVILSFLIITGCEKDDTSSENNGNTTGEVSFPEVSYSEARGGEIVFNGDSISYKGKSAVVQGTTITIKQAGEYTLRGTLYDGQLIIDAGKEATVTLHLDGVFIRCQNGPAIYSKTSDKTIINLIHSTKNSLFDGNTYRLPGGADEPDACLFSHTDLTIRGAGILNVNGNYRKGIKTKDDLRIISGTINVKSKDDGIQGRDSVVITGGTITVDAGGDGVKTTNIDTASKGYCSIEGGNIVVNSAQDGFDIANDFSMSGGTIKVTSGGGYNSDAKLIDKSQKGIKAQTDVLITNGVVELDCLDDALRGINGITISGGTLDMRSGDNAVRSFGTLAINGGKITVQNSKEALEAAQIYIADGEITAWSTDDCINAVGDMNTDKNSALLKISGGKITLDASGDGLDVNGSIEQSGGDLIIYGPTTDFNAAIDYDGTYTVSGGSFVAFGNSKMAQTASAESTQCGALVKLGSEYKASSTLVLLDDKDKEIFKVQSEKSYQSVAFSHPTLVAGTQYRIMIDGKLVKQYVQSSTISKT